MKAKQGINFDENLSFSMVRNRTIQDKLDLHGQYRSIEHWRDGKMIGHYNLENGITNEGKNYLFDCMFNGATQTAAGSWVIGLIDNTSFSALSAADIMSSHAGWIEYTGYSETTRVAWGQGASSGQTVTNGTPAVFDITVTGTLQGIFITTVATKGATTGKLWSTGQFNTTVPVSSGDQLKLSYAVAA